MRGSGGEERRDGALEAEMRARESDPPLRQAILCQNYARAFGESKWRLVKGEESEQIGGLGFKKQYFEARI